MDPSFAEKIKFLPLPGIKLQIPVNKYVCECEVSTGTRNK